MTILYFDCFSGASGDMILGALVDAGVPLAEIRRALGSLAIDPAAVWTERVVRAGVSATRFCVRGEEAAGAGAPSDHHHQHAHDHDHHHGPHVPGVDHDPGRHAHAAGGQHPHRTLAEIYGLIDGSALSASGKARAKALFERLGRVEAAIHGIALDEVHLHEVGALDSIIDIVGAVFALETLGAERIVASPLNVGSGTVRAAHGVYPVPAPATVKLLEGVPMYAGPQQAELVTPTGALLVSSYASAYGPIPPMRVRAVGYGAGTRDFADTPNVLRVLVGDAVETAVVAPDGRPVETVVVIEAEIDDMNPQIFGVVMERLLAEGALDVFYTPIQMKKNRPGTLLTVIAAPQARPRLTATIFRETTTIGVRYHETARECLERETVTVETALGAVRVKVARRSGAILNVSPEFEDCVRLAAQHDRPVKEVQALASTAFLSR